VKSDVLVKSRVNKRWLRTCSSLYAHGTI